MADVFISYSQKAQAPTLALAAYLASRGLDVWYDVRLGPTDVFWKVIMKHITEARSVITIWSAPAIESDWVYGESMLAHQQNKLVCVHAADISPAQVPLPFNGYNVCKVEDRAKIDQGLTTLGLTLSAPQPLLPPPAPLILRPDKKILRAPSDGELKALAVLFDAIKDSRDPSDWEDLLQECGGLDHALVRQAVKRFDALKLPTPTVLRTLPAPPAPTTEVEINAAAEDVTLRIDPAMHTATIQRIAVTADGRTLATSSHDKTVRLWSLPEGRLMRTLRPAIGSGDDGKVYAVAIDPAGRWVAAGGFFNSKGDEFISIFDPATGAILRRLGPLPNVIGHLTVSADGRRLAAGLGSNGIRVWRMDTWAIAFEDADYAARVYGLAFAPDGRLATTSCDGHVRLYAATGQRTAKVKAPSGESPFGIAVTADGSRIAIGYDDAARVDVLDGATLAPLARPDVTGFDNGDLSSVAWLDGGRRLAAAGRYDASGSSPILVWNDGGRGNRTAWPGPASTVMDLAALPGGGLAYGSFDAAFGVIDARGQPALVRTAPLADLRGKLAEHFLVSRDGTRLRFGLNPFSASPVLLDLAGPSVTPSPTAPTGLERADVTSLAIRDWEDKTTPSLDGKPLTLQQYETSRSLAILPGSGGFILGTEWWLRRFDRAGAQLWEHPVPGVVWGVNTAREGRLIVAAYGDGTLRWHRADTGVELLAAFVHVDRSGAEPVATGVIVWTPAGHYACTPGAENLIGWHVNRGLDQAADFYPAATFAAAFHKPDMVAKALDVVG